MTGEVNLSDFETAREHWIEFYKKYDIDASSLERICLTDYGRKKRSWARRKYGFDKYVMIPKGVSPENLVKNKNFSVFAGSDERDQNSGKKGIIKFWDDSIVKYDFWTKNRIWPDVFFMKNNLGVNEGTRKHTYGQIIKIENEMGLSGIDIVIALILDRHFFNQTKKHLFMWREKSTVWLTLDKGRNCSLDQCPKMYWHPNHRMWIMSFVGELHSLDELVAIFVCNLETKNKY